MNVFIADKLPGWCAERVERMGASAVVRTGLKGVELADAVAQAGADVLIVRSTKVTSEVIDAVPVLSLIIRAGAGVDNIDTDHAAERGIYVANCPGTNSAAVAELAMGPGSISCVGVPRSNSRSPGASSATTSATRSAIASRIERPSAPCGDIIASRAPSRAICRFEIRL